MFVDDACLQYLHYTDCGVRQLYVVLDTDDAKKKINVKTAAA